MKTKLLKKVRKRYSINHYPKGVYLCGRFLKGPVTILQDNHNQFKFWNIVGGDKQKALDELMDELKKWILKDCLQEKVINWFLLLIILLFQN
jgi:hypothetical protein